MTDSTTGEVRHAGVHGKAMPALSRDHQTRQQHQRRYDRGV
jgi:hypothetical protein